MKKQTIGIHIKEFVGVEFWNWYAFRGKTVIAEGMFYKTRRQAVAAATRFLSDIHNFNYSIKSR